MPPRHPRPLRHYHSCRSHEGELTNDAALSASPSSSSSSSCAVVVVACCRCWLSSCNVISVAAVDTVEADRARESQRCRQDIVILSVAILVIPRHQHCRCHHQHRHVPDRAAAQRTQNTVKRVPPLPPSSSRPMIKQARATINARRCLRHHGPRSNKRAIEQAKATINSRRHHCRRCRHTTRESKSQRPRALPLLPLLPSREQP